MGYDDVRAMLAVARPGEAIADWRKEAAAVSRLPTADRRKTQLRIAERILRPIDGRIADDAFLSDLHISDDATSHDLIYARYLAATPAAVGIARALLAPHTAANDKHVTRAELESVLARLLLGTKLSTIARSRTAALTEYARAGIISPSRDGSFEILRTSPSPIAFYYLLGDDLAERREATDAWIVSSSLPAAMFALTPEQVVRYLKTLVEVGRLRRSYYGGEPRILAA
jgi:hypothetical protein